MKKIYENISFKEIQKKLDTTITYEPQNDLDLFIEQAEKYTPNGYDGKNNGRLYSSIDQYALQGQIWTSTTNASMGTMSAHPVGLVAEFEIISLLGNKIGYSQAEGLGVSGGSAGNFEGINIARHIKFPHIKEEGNGPKKMHIYTSEDSHYSIKKAAQFLGIGSNNVIKIETNEKGEMVPEKLEEAITQSHKISAVPLIIISTAGTTVGGAFDVIADIDTIAKKHEIYHHVDASWGGAALFAYEKNLLDIEKVDSVVFDAHKAIGSGVTSAFFITKHKEILRSANSVNASYIKGEIPEHARFDTLDMSQQCGRRADVFGFYFQLRAIGIKGIEKRIADFYEQTDYIKNSIQKNDELIMVQSAYFNTCFQIISPIENVSDSEFTEMVHQHMEREAVYKVGRGIWKGKSIIRYVSINPNTTKEDIDNFVEYMTRTRKKLSEVPS